MVNKKIGIFVSGQPRFVDLGKYLRENFIVMLNHLGYDVDVFEAYYEEPDLDISRLDSSVHVVPNYEPSVEPQNADKIRCMGQHFIHYLLMGYECEKDYDIVIRTRSDFVFNPNLYQEWVKKLEDISNEKYKAFGVTYAHPYYWDIRKPFTRCKRPQPKYATLDDWAIVTNAKKWCLAERREKYTPEVILELMEEAWQDEDVGNQLRKIEYMGNEIEKPIPEAIWTKLVGVGHWDWKKVHWIYNLVGGGMLIRPHFKQMFPDTPLEEIYPHLVEQSLQMHQPHSDEVLQYSVFYS